MYLLRFRELFLLNWEHVLNVYLKYFEVSEILDK
jgi:hypothetical protein